MKTIIPIHNKLDPSSNFVYIEIQGSIYNNSHISYNNLKLGSLTKDEV